MAKDRNIIHSDAEYTRSYENMRGVDLSADADSITSRYGYLENMYVDYEGGGEAVESIPGYRKIASFGAAINGIYSHNVGMGAEFIIVHAGSYIYRFAVGDRDDIGTPSPIASLGNTKSHAFTFGKRIYLMDGKKLISIDGDGIAAELDSSTMKPYVPTTYVNGEKNEDRNLLTREFRERYYIGATDPTRYGTPGVVYSVTDAKSRTCAAVGAVGNISGPLHIPSYTRIGGESYEVTEIGTWAFADQTGITELVTNPNMLRIGYGAFFDCSAITRAVISATVTDIDDYAFYGCASMTECYLGMGIEYLGSVSFGGCPAMDIVHYDGNETEYEAISNSATIKYDTIAFHSSYRRVTLGVPIMSPAVGISSIKVDGTECTYTYDPDTAVAVLDYDERSSIEGREVVIEGYLDSDESEEGSFLASDMGNILAAKDAILGCTVSEVFDGRVFLSGNPSLPGAVFYCGNTEGGSCSPLYFPSHGYFTDGVAGYPVTSLLSSHGELVVFKSGDDGGGSIFYHKRDTDASGRTVYPRSYVHGGVAVSGCTFNFFDDAVFLSEAGVLALEKATGGDYKEIRSRSENVNIKLSSEESSAVRMTEWRGYLVVMAGDRFYLGDSRGRFTKNGSRQYEWYRLAGIGSYENDERVYRYASTAAEGYSVHTDTDKPASGTVESVAGEDGSFYYYVREGGTRYAVYPTEEYTGGDFSPATEVLGTGGLLFFGTSAGVLCLFNSDKRGIAPDRLSSGEDFDAAEYEQLMGDSIHPDFYSFAGHAMRCALRTKSDSCELPYLTKSTVRGSLVIKCKSFERSGMICEVGTDRSGYKRLCAFPCTCPGFSEFDFSAFTDSTGSYSILRIPEGERGWVEKDIAVYSEEFCSPIGIYSIHYRYKVKGRIKR